MTENERQEFEAKIDCVAQAIHDIEAKIGRKVIQTPTVFDDNGNFLASFHGLGMLFYYIPYEIFMALPSKDLVIEIMRAMTIEFNDYENE